MSDLLEIFVFAASVMADILNALDNVYLGSHSILDIFIGLYLLNCTFWFIFRVLGHDPGPDETQDSIWGDSIWGETDQQKSDRAADADTREHYQKQQWTDRDDGHRDHGFEYDGAGNLKRMHTVKE